MENFFRVIEVDGKYWNDYDVICENIIKDEQKLTININDFCKLKADFIEDEIIYVYNYMILKITEPSNSMRKINNFDNINFYFHGLNKNGSIEIYKETNDDFSVAELNSINKNYRKYKKDFFKNNVKEVKIYG